MDYQNGIVGMLDEPDELLSNAAHAIATVRRAGGHVGYVRVAFEDTDLEAIPPTSRMGARVGASADAFRNDSRETAVHERDASDRDYRVLVVADATADRESDVHQFLIERIFPRQADVITTAQLEDLLSSS